jgi:hypothetical protein
MWPSERPPPQRTIHVGDGIAWLREAELTPEMAIVTSLPDVSEVQLDLDAWARWFEDTVTLACARVSERAVAIFYQTDIKREGRWIDKGFLVAKGADRAASALLWHRIVCRFAPGTVTMGRPTYSHLMCYSRALTLPPDEASADVLPEPGEMPWPRAMGAAACRAVVRFLARHTDCTTVVDPFCGHGTMLAVANAHGLHAIGVELSRKRAEKARALVLPP